MRPPSRPAEELQFHQHHSRLTLPVSVWVIALAWLGLNPVPAATVSLFTNSFEAYSAAATNLSDTVDADPVGAEWNVADDTAQTPTTAGAGVQVIDWLARSGSRSLLLRSGTEAQVFFTDARSGTNYQLDFWLHVVKSPGDRSFLVILRAEGADSNGDDYIAYRSDRTNTTPDKLYYFDGIGPVVSPATWTDTGASLTQNQWQHHRIIINAVARTMNVYVDDMANPIVTNVDLARPDSPVPTLLRIIHEGNSADDGYFAIDDLSFTVDGAVDLATTLTDGFESYPARTSAADDANPQGAWLVVESDGTGNGRSLAPAKVQVVDSSVVTPHSGSKCLKLEAGQRAGASIAWGVTPQSDVQITWWARVPEAIQSAPTADAVFLRMSLYGAEGGNTLAGDSALMGWGIRRQSGTNCVDGTSLVYFTTAWQDTTADYTPNVWEEFRLTTHNSQGTYTIVKNPSSPNPQVVVDRGPFVASSLTWGPTFMVAFSSSNGTNHPPVYVDDIEIKSLTSNPNPLPEPYTVMIHSNRFTNVTVLKVGGSVGKAVVDPRDNSTILFTLDAATPDGGIYRAQKVASGNWAVDPQPIVTGIDRPSGLAVESNGTLWWVHDFTMSLRRLKEPWATTGWEEVVSDFGYSTGDDDPIDVAITPSSFNGSIGKPNHVVVIDRGSDSDPFQAAYQVNPTTTSLNQTYQTNGVPPPADWWQFLVQPQSVAQFGGQRLNCLTPLAESGEMLSVGGDGTITAFSPEGGLRTIIPATLWQDVFTGGPAPRAVAVATDPNTGRVWVADDTRDEVWSIDPDVATQGAAPDQKEISFQLTDAARPDRQIQMHEPSLGFAANGAFMVATDTSTGNGGGRLLIFHNESIAIPSFSITSAARAGQGFALSWESAGAARYDVLRGTNVANPAGFQAIATNLTALQFVDTNAPAGAAYYRVIAKP